MYYHTWEMGTATCPLFRDCLLFRVFSQVVYMYHIIVRNVFCSWYDCIYMVRSKQPWKLDSYSFRGGMYICACTGI